MPQTRDGGKPNVKDLRYSPPQGPMDQSRQGPGLGGTNHGNCGTQGETRISDRESGSPGIGGSNHGNSPTQR